jgi:ADP-ribosylation factor GTPase-activating protein 1
MESYGPEGGYRKGMDMQEKYNCWAATQYREKVSFHALESFGS